MKNCLFMSLEFWAQRFCIEESRLKWGIAIVNSEEHSNMMFPVIMVEGSTVMIDILRDTLLTCKSCFGRSFECHSAEMAELGDKYVFTSGRKVMAISKRKMIELYEHKVFGLEEKVLP